MYIRMIPKTFIFLPIMCVFSCNDLPKSDESDNSVHTTIHSADTTNQVRSNAAQVNMAATEIVDQKGFPQITSVTPKELVSFAKTLIGVPYKYASTDPNIGFDCSGFITYVFNHFNIKVPRSSVDFTYVGREVSLKNAREGDLILFTGTVDSIKTVGHMGIVTQNIDTLQFIHSTSGRAYAVANSNFSDHYKKRFVKVVRIFAE